MAVPGSAAHHAKGLRKKKPSFSCSVAGTMTARLDANVWRLNTTPAASRSRVMVIAPSATAPKERKR